MVRLEVAVVEAVMAEAECTCPRTRSSMNSKWRKHSTSCRPRSSTGGWRGTYRQMGMRMVAKTGSVPGSRSTGSLRDTRSLQRMTAVETDSATPGVEALDEDESIEATEKVMVKSMLAVA
eukprot:3597535-Prymnesium_polylepis.2